MRACNLALIVHGGIVLMLSQVAGYAFFHALRHASEARVSMWRMSHAASSAGAILLIALGPVVPQLSPSPTLEAALADTWIGATYALCVGTIVAAISGRRGRTAEPPWSNRAVYVLYVAGALGSTLATLLLVYAAVRAYA